MSGIFGIVDFENGEIAPGIVEKMAAAMHHWGPDGRAAWRAGSAALGHCLLYNTPEAIHERLPRADATTGIAFTAEARLDNRDEICDQLRIPHPERPTTPDGELIYQAYLQWGEACPDRLVGDWSFAAWHAQERKLFLARDHQGNTAITYWQDGSRLAFASDPAALYAIGAPRRLNEFYLGQLLMSWSAYNGPQTIDQDVARIPPAHVMRATPAELRMTRYWRLEDTPELRLGSFDDYVEGFYEVYAAAVHSRIRSYRPIGTTLSGGLDSGSVTALAAQALAQQGQELTAFTSVPLHETSGLAPESRFGDETEFASSTARFLGNVNHVLLKSAHITPIQGIRRILQISNEPAHSAGNYFWIVDLLDRAQEAGLGTLLTGQGGNATISWTGAPEYRSAAAAIRKIGWRKFLRRQLPLAVQRGIIARGMQRRGWRHTAIHPDFAERIELIPRLVAAIGADITINEGPRTPREQRYAIILPGAGRVGDIWSMQGAAHSLEVRDPTLDKRVMAYTIAIPDAVYDAGYDGDAARAHGIDRRIIRAAMQNHLPDDVRLNQRRGLQAADIVHRLRTNAAEVTATLDEIDCSPTNTYLDLPNMRRVWNMIQQTESVEATTRSVTVLTRGIMAGLFLNSLDSTGR